MAPGADPFAVATANRELLERILSESGVAQRPAGPAPLGFVEAWSAAATRWLLALLERSGLFETVGKAALVAAVAAIAAALLLMALLVIRRVRSRGPKAPFVVEARPGEPALALPLDSAAWRLEVEARLARGEIRAALEALWWWLARALAGDAAAASWTTGDLLRRVRRGDLAPFARRLESLMYGSARPSEAEVRACLDDWERALA